MGIGGYTPYSLVFQSYLLRFGVFDGMLFGVQTYTSIYTSSRLDVFLSLGINNMVIFHCKLFVFRG